MRRSSFYRAQQKSLLFLIRLRSHHPETYNTNKQGSLLHYFPFFCYIPFFCVITHAVGGREPVQAADTRQQPAPWSGAALREQAGEFVSLCLMHYMLNHES